MMNPTPISFRLSLRILCLLVMAVLWSGFTPLNVQGQQKDYPTDTSLVDHPDWSKDANIYEVNIRQYSEEGTFKAFEQDLPRLKKMGVEIVWLMPIHPIGKKNRKGKLGSYYSVKDYRAVNPHFGTLADFKSLVRRVHELDMKIILDWVANHTAWDHPWTRKHPSWYKNDENGNFVPPVEDWSDVIALDYDNQQMRDAMISAMEYWVRETNIDGYRCDVAHMIPTSFWNRVRKELNEIKPVFLLAEAEIPEQHYKAFDMSYAWHFHHLMNQVAAGKKEPEVLEDYMSREDTLFPENAYRMNFTSNHDENSWNGSVFERYGEGAKTFAVLASTIFGMPLIYNGQEAAMKERLEFFKRDPIQWDNYPMQDFYHKLLHLKKRNKALWNGRYGGDFQEIIDENSDVVSYKRIRGSHEVFVVLNLSDKSQQINYEMEKTTYDRLFSDQTSTLGSSEMSLEPWEYRVYTKQ